MLPIDFPTDREVLEAALKTVGLVPPAEAKLMWARNTLHLAELECSESYLPEATARDDLEVLTAPRPLPLSASGNLESLQAWHQDG